MQKHLPWHRSAVYGCPESPKSSWKKLVVFNGTSTRWTKQLVKLKIHVVQFFMATMWKWATRWSRSPRNAQSSPFPYHSFAPSHTSLYQPTYFISVLCAHTLEILPGCYHVHFSNSPLQAKLYIQALILPHKPIPLEPWPFSDISMSCATTCGFTSLLTSIKVQKLTPEWEETQVSGFIL